MPFYDLQPANLVVRSEFYTDYKTSSKERKYNIALAVKSLNNTFIDVGAEFSFNLTIGARTEKRGYKKANIIKNGQFEKGVGGGVCQVSTTLYNAVLLANLKITEYHQHSLAVNYVEPSFDAMVNSGSADLKFVNNTHNPLIILADANGSLLKITVMGEPLGLSIVRKSQIVSYIPAQEPVERLVDETEYPELAVGESKVLVCGKQGMVSKGYLYYYSQGKFVFKKLLRSNVYAPIRGVIVKKAEKTFCENQ